MIRRTGFILIAIVALVLIGAGLCFSQEATQGVVVKDTHILNDSGPETQWLWGEVVSVDAQNNLFVVKYFDYEADQEKEITLLVAQETTFEAIKSLADINPRDSVSVDYIVSPDNKNIAKNISIEKPEGQEAAEELEIPIQEGAMQEGSLQENAQQEVTPQDISPEQPEESPEASY